MKKVLLLLTMAGALLSCQTAKVALPAQVEMSKETLMDKIKGGWAGQTIGCT